MGRPLTALAALAVLIPLLAIAAVTGALTSHNTPAPSQTAITDIPPDYQRLYLDAAATCPGLPWTVLAAIGKQETDHGRSPLPGVYAGANAAGAEGPMQFEPATFAEVVAAHPPPPGGAHPPSPYDPHDAVYAAASYLCDHGARGGADLPRALYTYSKDLGHVARVLATATSYTDTDGTDTAGGAGEPGAAALVAVDYATAQLGLPYQWGGNGTPGWDCSGLTHAAYAAAGISIPRTAQTQYDTGPHVEGPLAIGDLAFFGPTPGQITHVGLISAVLNGATMMVDAPHQGANVRVESFTATIGAPWGDDIYLGATRPSAPPAR